MAKKQTTINTKRSSHLQHSMEQKKKIYNRIKANLALHQVKNKELAEHLQVSEQTVSKWCTNYSQPSIPQLYEIAMFLQVAVPELLEPIKLR